jgi:hypothetical protein
MFNVLYKGRKIYTSLEYEECTEILDNMTQQYYAGDDIDLNEIELEET